ncbi:glycosyltransferase [Rheinheimera sp. 4Y26]|uniref:glycosyltransferase n=1 Tax=Rheinheimera sp. 4Y26 TaxID=2977811 RepID=UPI0021B0CCBB|nr:glycosyltransferase [Rheinheimera sp. 4Y26]MCT6700629.1 glycosyltransferase [Rheinheimera sp. 4Y26]
MKPSLIYFLDKFPCYSETFVLDQLTGLIDRGFDVKIIALSQDPRPLSAETEKRYQLSQRCTYLLPQTPATKTGRVLQRARLIATGLGKKSVWRVLCTPSGSATPRSYLAAIIAAHQQIYAADYLICHFGTTASLAQQLQQAGLLAGKIVPVFHGFDLSEQKVLSKYQSCYQELFLVCPAVFAISKLWCQRLAELGCPKDKIKLLRTGVDTQKFLFPSPERALQQPLQLLSVARFTEKKGLEFAISAIALLKSAGVAVQYRIIGDGPLRPALTAQIHNLGLEQDIQLCGVQPPARVAEALAQSDVFLLPSVTAGNGDMEGIPVSLMEAMASGVICLSTYHSGIPELICHGKSGLLVAERDAAAIATELQRLIQGHYALGELRKNARASIEQEFDQQQIYDGLAAYFTDAQHGVN